MASIPLIKLVHRRMAACDVPGSSVDSTNMGSGESEISEYIQRLCKIFFCMVCYVLGHESEVVFLLNGCFIAALLLSVRGKQQ